MVSAQSLKTDHFSCTRTGTSTLGLALSASHCHVGVTTAYGLHFTPMAQSSLSRTRPRTAPRPSAYAHCIMNLGGTCGGARSSHIWPPRRNVELGEPRHVGRLLRRCWQRISGRDGGSGYGRGGGARGGRDAAHSDSVGQGGAASDDLTLGPCGAERESRTVGNRSLVNPVDGARRFATDNSAATSSGRDRLG